MMQELKTQTKVSFSRIHYCPGCHRKLSYTREIQGHRYIEVKHKGLRILADEIVVKCIGCDRYYAVNAQQGLNGEVYFGND